MNEDREVTELQLQEVGDRWRSILNEKEVRCFFLTIFSLSSLFLEFVYCRVLDVYKLYLFGRTLFDIIIG